MITINKPCTQCGTVHYIKMEQKSYNAWKSGVSIQNVAPHLSTDERELLISGFCGKCFDLAVEVEDNLDPEQEIMRTFLLELALEEQANGSDLLARTFAGIADDVEQFESIKDVAAKVFETYFDFHMDKEAEGPIPDED